MGETGAVLSQGDCNGQRTKVRIRMTNREFEEPMEQSAGDG